MVCGLIYQNRGNPSNLILIYRRKIPEIAIEGPVILLTVNNSRTP